MNTYKTHHKDYLELNLIDYDFEVIKFPSDIINNKVLFYLMDFAEKKRYLETQFVANKKFSVCLNTLEKGKYSINIFAWDSSNQSFFGYYYKYNLFLEIYETGCRFISPFPLINNSIKYSQLNELHDRKVSSNQNPEIVELAKRITSSKLVNYAKIRAIHDWIARNVYYDNESLNFDFYVHRDHSPKNTLATLKGVCQGYANLADALCSSLGFKSLVIPCFALGLGTEGYWDSQGNKSAKANHVMNAVFIDNRWILMDVTWDSFNYIENSVRKASNSVGYSHKYFDPTLHFISNTHKLIF